MNNIRFNLSHVLLIKQRENSLFVWYKFEIYYQTDKYHLDKKGNKISTWEPKYGIVKISKNFYNPDPINKEKIIEIVQEGTDDVFLKLSKNDLEKIMCVCASAINLRKKGLEFPERASREV